MTEEKGLDPAIADQIGEFVKLKGKDSISSMLTHSSRPYC